MRPVNGGLNIGPLSSNDHSPPHPKPLITPKGNCREPNRESIFNDEEENLDIDIHRGSFGTPFTSSGCIPCDALKDFPRFSVVLFGGKKNRVRGSQESDRCEHEQKTEESPLNDQEHPVGAYNANKREKHEDDAKDDAGEVGDVEVGVAESDNIRNTRVSRANRRE